MNECASMEFRVNLDGFTGNNRLVDWRKYPTARSVGLRSIVQRNLQNQNQA